MERPERIVLFMIGAFTNRMAAVMWVIGVLSIVTVVDRIYYTYLELNDRPQPRADGPRAACFVRAFYWTDERATFAYDLWVIAILAFVWLTPPDWLGDPMAVGLAHRSCMQMDRLGIGARARRAPSRQCRIEAVPAARLVGAGRADEHALASTRRAAGCEFAGPPQTMQIASVLVMYSAIASSCGIGSNGLPR